MAYLKIHNLSVRYPFQYKDVLKGVNLTIQKGEKVLVLGPSGCGKSTLILTLNGIIPRSMEAEMNGTVLIDDKLSNELSFSEMSQHIGILFQDPETQFCMLTVEDEIVFGMENLKLSKEEMDRRLERSLDLVGLTDWRNAQLKELSGGMKQKLGIACLLAMDPEVFILDEPTANLDPASTEEILNLLIKLSNELNKTLIFIEHKLDHLLPHLERVIVLGKEGKIIADQTPRSIFENDYSLLRSLGVWVPQICRYAKKLESLGMRWRSFPFTIEQWINEFKLQGLDVPQDRIETKERQFNHKQEKQAPILQLRDVSFAYKEHKVLNNLNFSIQSGDFVALLGPNGTGKSTLAQLLIGLLKPNQGDVLLNGTPLNQLKTQELMQQVGFVFQNPEHQFVCDSVEQELSYSLKILGWTKEAWQPRVDELLEQFHLVEHRHHHPFSLSQGQKRRLSVATMLMSDQQLLILDEPTFGQDFINTEALMILLKALNQSGKTIIMITHDMELVFKYTNKVLLLHQGEAAYQGTVTAFFEKKDLLKKASIKIPVSYALTPWIKAFEETKALC